MEIHYTHCALRINISNTRQSGSSAEPDDAPQPVPWHILIPEDDIIVVEAMGFKAVESSVTAWAEGLRELHSPIVAK